MNIVERTKKYLGERSIRRSVAKNARNIGSSDIKTAKKIGILFNATHNENFEIIKGLAKDLSSGNQEISVLGYVNSKQLIDHYLYRKGFEFFTKSHLNWYNKPNSESINNFVNTEFDILIYLSLEEYFPLKYVLAISKAKFKVGRFSADQEHLDMMIDIEKEKEAMQDLKEELDKELNTKKEHLTNYDQIANQKASVEIQMNFLINQLLHYLGQIKK